MNFPHHHQFEPYHLTEILYFDQKHAAHGRLFEACLICGVCRVKNLAPKEVPPSIYLILEES